MPPRGVKKGTKRARQYEHIKESQRERGAKEGRAEDSSGRESPALWRRLRCTCKSSTRSSLSLGDRVYSVWVPT